MNLVKGQTVYIKAKVVGVRGKEAQVQFAEFGFLTGTPVVTHPAHGPTLDYEGKGNSPVVEPKCAVWGT